MDDTFTQRWQLRRANKAIVTIPPSNQIRYDSTAKRIQLTRDKNTAKSFRATTCGKSGPLSNQPIHILAGINESGNKISPDDMAMLNIDVHL